MIRSTLFVCLLFFSTLAYAQQDGDAAYSFGVGGYSYMALPKMLRQTEGRRYLGTNFSNYLIKFDNNLFSYRLSGGYLNKSIEFSNNCTNCQIASGKVKDYFFKAGFEKNFNYGPVQPYMGVDLGYKSDEFNGTGDVANAQAMMMSARKRGFTISPVLGIKVSPVKAISIFAEGNVEYFYAWGKEGSYSTVNPENNAARKFKKAEYLFNPVSVGIQVHLDRQK